MNLTAGKTRDGGSIVGASVFYKDVSGDAVCLSPLPSKGSQNSLDRLEQELKVAHIYIDAHISTHLHTLTLVSSLSLYIDLGLSE